MAISTVEEALKSVLATDSGVKAITTRFYPAAIPQNPTYPLIVYFKVTGVRDHCLRGPTGLAMPRFQIEAWAETYAGAKALANAIRVALDGKAFTVDTVVIKSILIQSERDFPEPAAGCHRAIQDFIVTHIE